MKTKKNNKLSQCGKEPNLYYESNMITEQYKPDTPKMIIIHIKVELISLLEFMFKFILKLWRAK